MDANFVIYNVGFIWNASKNLDYKKQTIHVFKILIDFFQKNNLFTRTILQENEFPTKDTKILRSDFTEEGYLFIKSGAVDRWFSAHDRGTPVTNICILERGLKKIRK